MNKKKTLILLVGETGCGKDTVANLLPYPKVISYKTGKMRPSDVQGLTHIFIDDKEMDELEKRNDIIAWTKTGKTRYCATAEQLSDDINIYIINPDGVRWFKQNYHNDDINIITIGLYLPMGIRVQRCKLRGDDPAETNYRIACEQNEYDEFRMHGNFDYIIRNEDSKNTAKIIKNILRMVL